MQCNDHDACPGRKGVTIISRPGRTRSDDELKSKLNKCDKPLKPGTKATKGEECPCGDSNVREQFDWPALIKKNKMISKGTSQVVPHPSTNPS